MLKMPLGRWDFLDIDCWNIEDPETNYLFLFYLSFIYHPCVCLYIHISITRSLWECIELTGCHPPLTQTLRVPTDSIWAYSREFPLFCHQSTSCSHRYIWEAPFHDFLCSPDTNIMKPYPCWNLIFECPESLFSLWWLMSDSRINPVIPSNVRVEF